MNGPVGKPVSLGYLGSDCDIQKLASSLRPFFGPSRGSTRQGQGNTRPKLTIATAPNTPRRGPIQNRDPKWGYIGDDQKFELADLLRGGCGWVAHVLATGGADQIEPLWREALVVSYYCAGRTDAHRLSQGHPGYDHADTEDKYDRVEKDRLRGSYGWPQCRTIHGHGAAQCVGCPHLTAGKSPFNHAKKVTADGKTYAASGPPPGAVPPHPNADLPEGWNRDANGHVYIMVRDPDSADENVMKAAYASKSPMWNLRPQMPPKGSEVGWLIVFESQLNATTYKEIVIEYGLLQDPRALAARAHNQGFSVAAQCQKWFQLLMSSFIEDLRSKVVTPSENLGWSAEEGVETGFVYGKTRWNCKGNTPVVHTDPELSQLYYPTGEMDAWRKASMLVFDRGRPDLEAIVSTAFAAPLVAITGHLGLIISAFSQKSGVGKTTALKIGAAVWGHPTKTLAGVTTQNFLNKQLATVRHLPVFYDEARIRQELIEMLFDTSQGKLKSRLNRASQVQHIDDYSTILTLASNNSLLDFVAEHTRTTAAGLMRLYEFQAERPDAGLLTNMADAQMAVGALNHNYGMAGLEYAKFLGQHVDDVRKSIREYNTKFTTGLHATNDERFWIGSMVTMRVGAMLANSIGLTRFDERALVGFLVQEFERMRGSTSRKSTDVTRRDTIRQYVSDYVNDRQANTVRTDVIRTPRGNVQLRTNERAIRLPIRVHIAEDDNLMRVSQKDFREWLKEQGISERNLIFEKLVESGIATMPKSAVTLGAGYKQAGAREWVIEFDLNAAPDLIEK